MGLPGTSAAVRTAWTPARATAGPMSMDRIRADGWGERRVPPHSIRSCQRSLENANDPATLGVPSGRGALSPRRGGRVPASTRVSVTTPPAAGRRQPRDAAVAGAAAEVAADGLPDGELVGRRVGVEERVDGHQQTGGTEAALDGAGLDECPLHVGQLAVGGEALDGGDLAADGRGGQHEARAHQLAVDLHGAGAALPLLAGVLGAGQAEPLAQHPQEALAEVGVGNLVVAAVDPQHVGVGAHRSPPGKARCRARRARTPTAWCR